MTSDKLSEVAGWLFTIPSHRDGTAYMLAWLAMWFTALVPFALAFAWLTR